MRVQRRAGALVAVAVAVVCIAMVMAMLLMLVSAISPVTARPIVVIESDARVTPWTRTTTNTPASAPAPAPPLAYDQLGGKPYTVSYDSRAILINGNRVLLQSGSIHYLRSTPAMWAGLLNLTKASGLNTVQIFAFWDQHEADQGVYDFETFNRNLPEFLQLVADAGLFAFLRIGPYGCAEWTWGAMPLWVHQQGISVRSMDPRWLSVMETFVRKLVEVTEPYLARNGGPLIMAQIENEYGNVESSYPDGPEYVQWCGNLTLQLNLSIPWVMCQQSDAPSFIINACNGFYCDNYISGHMLRKQPAFWTENWAGWFQSWGEAKPARPSQDVAFAVARWIARGGAFHNYYMWHGGTTWGRNVGGPFIVTSYDYDAPLDEYGVPHPTKYPHVTALHKTINAYSAAIIGNDIPTPATPCSTCEVHIYGTALTNGIAFLSNWDTSNTYNMTVGAATFSVPAWTVFLVDLASLQAVYRTDVLQTVEAPKTTVSSSAVKATSSDLAFFVEPVGLYDPSHAISAYGPQDQIDVATTESDYLWYVADVQLTQAQVSSGAVTLSLANCGDIEYIFFNGQYVAAGEKIVSAQNFSLPTTGLVAGLPYSLQILSVTVGLQNYGAYLNRVTRGLVGAVQLDGVDLTKQQWYHQVGLQGESLQLYTPTGAMSSVWQTDTALVPVNVDRVWYRLTLTTPQVVSPSGNAPYPTFQVDMVGMGKGLIWVNGFDLGRFWDMQAPATCPPCVWQGSFTADKCRYDCGQQSQRYLHVPVDVLAPQGQSNVVVVFAERGGDPSTVVLRQRD